MNFILWKSLIFVNILEWFFLQTNLNIFFTTSIENLWEKWKNQIEHVLQTKWNNFFKQRQIKFCGGKWKSQIEIVLQTKFNNFLKNFDWNLREKKRLFEFNNEKRISDFCNNKKKKIAAAAGASAAAAAAAPSEFSSAQSFSRFY